MKAYVIGSSALHYWRRVCQIEIPEDFLLAKSLLDCPTTPVDLKSLGLERMGFGKDPVHLMVPDAGCRVSRTTYRYSVFPGALPDRAFHRINDRVFVASPEFCILQAASTLPVIRCLELCMELCGTYALVPENENGFVTRDKQLTSVDLIRSFINSAEGARGVRKAAALARYLQDGSRSPMETREYLLFCLPRKYGGYGLPKAQLNYRIELTSEEHAVARRKYFVCDMCWPKLKVVVEYDGDASHSTREARSNDAVKKNILTAKGYAVYTITGNEISDCARTKQLAESIARGLNYRLQKFPADWDDRHRGLRKELFRSLHR